MNKKTSQQSNNVEIIKMESPLVAIVPTSDDDALWCDSRHVQV
jgi:hypothetical protein